VPPVERVPVRRRRAPIELDDGGVVVGAPAEPSGPVGPRVGLPIVGCLVRLVVTVVLLAVLAIGALFALFGGAGGLQSWVVDVGQSAGVLEGVPEQTERGIAAYNAGDRAAAERELREAARLYPRSALALLYLARISTDAGQPERAGEYLRTAVAREPGSAAAHRELGAWYLSRSRRTAASGVNADAARQDLARAEQAYSIALRLDPRDASTLGYYGCVLALEGRTDEADALIEQAGPGAWQGCAREAPVVTPAP
jgi:Tfp pilus assembly protein PilF